MHPNIFWSYLVAHRLKRPLSGLLYSSLSHGNKPVIVTAGQVYDALQLSSSFFSACLLIDVFTGGLSDGWLRRMSLVPRCITFLCLEDYLKSLHNLPYLYRGPGGVCVYVQVCSASVFDGLLEKQLCVCVCMSARTCSMIVYLLPWCPVWSNTFISVLPKAIPDGMWSSNELQAEETHWASIGGTIHIWGILYDRSSYSTLWEADTRRTTD